jgi:hypothetical protein
MTKTIMTSGVTSRTPNPVPPVVITQSNEPDRHHSPTTCVTSSALSATMRQYSSWACNPCPMTIFLIVGPDLSALASVDAVSLTGERSWFQPELNCQLQCSPVKIPTRIMVPSKLDERAKEERPCKVLRTFIICCHISTLQPLLRSTKE